MRDMQLMLRAAGPADPDLVWQRYLRPALWSQFSPQIRRVECADPELRAGSRGRVHGPPGLAVDFLVSEVDVEARTWAWQVRVLLLGVRLRLRHGVLCARPGTSTWLLVSGPAPVVLAYAPLARWALGRLVRR